MTARIIAFSRADAATLDALTTPGGMSWVLMVDVDNSRLRLFDGIVVGGIEFATLADLGGMPGNNYIYSAPSTGATITLSEGDRVLIINPAATIATLTVVLPPNPVDGDVLELSSSKTITAITVNGTTQMLAANGGMSWRYRSSGTTWFRRY